MSEREMVAVTPSDVGKLSMADEMNAEWWKKQAEQYKSELDQLNPRLNVAEARVRELEAANQLMAKENQDALRIAEDLKSQLSQAAEAHKAQSDKLAEAASQADAMKDSNLRLTELLRKADEDFKILETKRQKLLQALHVSVAAHQRGMQETTEAISAAM